MRTSTGNCGRALTAAAAFALAGLAAGAVSPAAAQTDVLPATLSLEETKQCLLEERELRRQREELDARLPALTSEAEALERLRQQVEAAQARVFAASTPDPAARAEYEALRDRQYRDYDAYAERTQAYNADVTRYNEALAAYNARCASERYSEYNLRLAREQLGLR